MKKIMTQTLAMLLDAYREFNAKRMFWISLILSAAVMLVIGSIGKSGRHVTIFGFRTPVSNDEDLSAIYRIMFARFGMEWWLGWGAMILALVSTGSMFPDFLAGGSVDLYLCRPMGRARLYLTKYAAGLLFVALQAAAFSVAGYFTLGLRANVWEARVFMCIPMLACIFSYLFCVSALLGVVTRSSSTSVLLTILFWFMLFIVYFANHTLMTSRLEAERTIQFAQRENIPARNRLGVMPQLRTTQNAAEAQKTLDQIEPWQRWTTGVESLLPKTSRSFIWLDRLIEKAPPPMQGDPENFKNAMEFEWNGPGGEDPDINRRVDAIEQRRSPAWIIGTSLAFEAVILALGAWYFKRRDY